MNICHHFALDKNNETNYIWILVNHNSSLKPIDDLAIDLADKIVNLRCCCCKQIYDAWKIKVTTNSSQPNQYSAALLAFLSPVFGNPGNPKPDSHIEGVVAQYLWYFLALEIYKTTLVYIEKPSFEVTDHGCDGMVINLKTNNELMFRMWEIKKCTGKNSVGGTIKKAYDQIEKKSSPYLARSMTTLQETSNPELVKFSGKLFDLWESRSQDASIGVSISTNKSKVKSNCFNKFHTRFPNFEKPDGLLGMMSAIDDFSIFSNKVLGEIWKGL